MNSKVAFSWQMLETIVSEAGDSFLIHSATNIYGSRVPTSGFIIIIMVIMFCALTSGRVCFDLATNMRILYDYMIIVER